MNNTRLLVLSLLGLSLAGSAPLRAQRIQWGSVFYSDLVDSKGITLGDEIAFELGVFSGGFTPNESNTENWASNWQVFDLATYNGIEESGDDGIWGLFSSTGEMTSTGGSSNPAADTFDFQGTSAYLWIRNSDLPQPGSEWLLARSESWVFPTADPATECCGNSLPIQWSTSDLLASNVPIYGTQGGVEGGGLITQSGTYTLQTATFEIIPEVSTVIFVPLAMVLLTLHRRRETPFRLQP